MANERYKRIAGETSGSIQKKINVISETKANVSDDKEMDPVLSALTKLTQSVNNLTINKNPNRNVNNRPNGNNSRNFRINNNNYRNNGRNFNNMNNRNTYNPNNQNNQNNNSNNGLNQNNVNNYRNNRQFNNGFNNQNMNRNMSFNNNRMRNNIICNYCNRPGHIRANCRSNPMNYNNNSNNANSGINQNNNTAINDNSNQNINPVPVNSEHRPAVNNIILNTNINGKLIQIDVKINGLKFKALVDSGAELTLIKKSVADLLKLDLNPYKGPDIETADKTKIQTYGQTLIEMIIESNNLYKKYYSDSSYREITGRYLIRFGFINEI